MQFRQLTKDDIPSLLELYVQLDPKNAEPDCKMSLEIWERQIEGNPNIKYFGAVEGEKVVSSCYCVIIPNLSNYNQPICFVENVVTDKDFRKQGLARKVVQMAVEAAKSAGCYKVILQSGIARKEAHKFYESLGFNGESKKAFDMRL